MNRCFNLNISNKDLWIARAEPKSLEAFLRVVKSQGMSVTLMWSNIVTSHRMRKRSACV
jgi:hypothetical protein